MDPNHFKFIALHSFPHKESGLIVRGYDLEEGRLALFLRSGKQNRRQALSQLHPLSILEGTTSSFSKGEMKNIKEYLPIYRLTSIRESIIKGSIALFLSELILKTVREKEQNRVLFAFLERSILELEQCSSGVTNFHLWFVTHFTGVLGYLPTIPKESKGMLFDITSGHYCNREEESNNLFSGGNHLFSMEESELLWQLYHSEVGELEKIKVSGAERSNYLSQMLKYLTYHSGQQIECNSLSVLRQLFSG